MTEEGMRFLQEKRETIEGLAQKNEGASFVFLNSCFHHME